MDNETSEDVGSEKEDGSKSASPRSKTMQLDPVEAMSRSIKDLSSSLACLSPSFQDLRQSKQQVERCASVRIAVSPCRRDELARFVATVTLTPVTNPCLSVSPPIACACKSVSANRNLHEQEEPMTVTEIVNLAREERRADDLRIFIPDENTWKRMRSVSVRVSNSPVNARA